MPATAARPARAAPAVRDSRNITLNATGESLWGMLNGLVASSTVLVVLLRQYGASTVMIGAITAIEIGSTMAPQILGSALFASGAHRQRRLIVWHLAAIIPFLLVIAGVTFAGPRWHPAAVRWGVLAAYAGFMLGIGVVLAVWFDWLSGVFPQETRGRAFGLGFGASAVLNFGGGLIAGRLLALQDRIPSFSILYAAAAICGTASILTFSLIDDPNRLAAGAVPRPRVTEMIGWFRVSLADRNFRSFLVGRVLASAGFCIVPFVAVYYTSPEGGSLSPAQVVTLGVFIPAGAALSNLAFGWLGDHRGHRLGITAGAALQVLATVILLIARGPAGCACAYFAVGLCGGASAVSHHNMIFETCPHGNRLSHITIANLVLSCGVVFPLLAGVVVQTLGLRALLAGSLAASGAALFWFLLRVKEPRDLRR